MATDFRKLTEGCNAEPNAPGVRVSRAGADVHVEFRPNQYQYPTYAAVARIILTFHSCTRYRLGDVNDEGWYLGQCRFSKLAPSWGEFYEISGDLKLEGLTDWVEVGSHRKNTRHFLFYFRDEVDLIL